MKYKNKLAWQEQVLELLDKFIILTACEIESLLKLKGYKISRSQIYRFCASEPLIHSSSVLNGSKTLAYRTSRSLSSIEQYTILLHNEFFINKGMSFPKPQTKDSLFKYIPLRVEQLKNEIGNDRTIIDELLLAQNNYEQQEKLQTPSDMSYLFRIVQKNRIQFVASKNISWWIVYDSPNNSYESFKKKLVLLQDFLVKKSFDSLSCFVEVITFEEKKMKRYVNSFLNSSSYNQKIKIKICCPSNIQ